MAFKILATFVGLLATVRAWSEPNCFKSIADLKRAQVHTLWQETTADDGKPLNISVSEQNDQLYVDVVKGGETWIAGLAEICERDEKVTVRLKKGMKIGESVPTIVSMALKADPELTMKKRGPDKMRVSTLAWGGDFKGSTAQ